MSWIGYNRCPSTLVAKSTTSELPVPNEQRRRQGKVNHTQGMLVGVSSLAQFQVGRSQVRVEPFRVTVTVLAQKWVSASGEVVDFRVKVVRSNDQLAEYRQSGRLRQR